MRARPYYKGTPYAIELERLRKEYPVNDLQEGVVLQHHNLRGVIGTENIQRYRQIMRIWKRELLEKQIVLFAVRGIGYGVANNAEKLNISENTIERVGKVVQQGAIYVKSIQPAKLTEEDKRIYDFTVRKIGALSLTMQNIKKLEPPEMLPTNNIKQFVG